MKSSQGFAMQVDELNDITVLSDLLVRSVWDWYMYKSQD
jgi:hypothetical protein